MKIASVESRVVSIPAKLVVSEKKEFVNIVLTVVQTDEGLTGVGISRGMWSRFAVRELINRELAPFLVGRDPLDIASIWADAFWDVMPDLRTNFHARAGLAGQAMGGVDQALWDLKGKILGQPVYRLLGGAKKEIEVYTTFGWRELDREELVELARILVSEGHDKLKIQAVGAQRGMDIEEDAARVRLVREAVGDEIKVLLDANASYNYSNALQLAKRSEPYNLTFFEHPILGRDVRAMSELRKHTTIRIAGRGTYENIFSTRDLIVGGGVDVLGMTALDGGGYTESVKMGHLAQMYHLPIAIGGGFYVPNSHLIAGLSNGWMAENHLLFAVAWERLLTGFPQPKNGRLTMPDKPGIGWDLDEDVAREYTVEQ